MRHVLFCLIVVVAAPPLPRYTAAAAAAAAPAAAAAAAAAATGSVTAGIFYGNWYMRHVFFPDGSTRSTQ